MRYPTQSYGRFQQDYKRFSLRPIATGHGLIKHTQRKGCTPARRMFRYIFTFSFVLLLGIVACAAAIAADAPAFGQIAFALALGLFVAALAGSIPDRRPRRSK